MICLAVVGVEGKHPHHESQPQYQMNDVLIFEEVTQQNILCQHKRGLFTSEWEIMIGQYEVKDENIDLALNDFKR